jgi:hypothetical protein
MSKPARKTNGIVLFERFQICWEIMVEGEPSQIYITRIESVRRKLEAGLLTEQEAINLL